MGLLGAPHFHDAGEIGPPDTLGVLVVDAVADGSRRVEGCVREFVFRQRPSIKYMLQIEDTASHVVDLVEYSVHRYMVLNVSLQNN